MKAPLVVLLATVLVLCLQTKAFADPVPPSVPKDKKEAYPHDIAVKSGDVYGTVKFTIPSFPAEEQKGFWKRLGSGFFGAKQSEYVLTVELTDPNLATPNKLVSQAVIAHFVVDRSGKFTFNEQKVNNFSRAKWNGALLENVIVDANTNEMSIAVKAYQSQATSLRTDLVDISTKLFSEATALIGYAPLGEAVKVAWTKVRDLSAEMFGIFSGSQLILSESDMSFIVAGQGESPNPKKLFFKIPRDLNKPNGPAIPVTVEFKTSRSLVDNDGKVVDGYYKFSSPRVDTFLTEFNFDKKPILATLKENTILSGFLDNVTNGKRHTTDVSALCSILFVELDKYYSHADSHAYLWAFLSKYKDPILASDGGQKCFDGNAEALKEYGLVLRN